MAKTLDFNTLKRPTLTLVMQDEKKTRIVLTCPTVDLMEELRDSLPELEPVLSSSDRDGIEAIYDLTARLVNCNRSFIQVTGVELREKYGMGLDDLIVFYQTYVGFIAEINDAKN